MVMPRTLSASSLLVADKCMSRFMAENLNYTPNLDSIPAMVGTAVHGGLEEFVRATRLEVPARHGWQLEKLISYYQLSYIETFSSADYDTDWYRDGYDLTVKWFNRTDLMDTNVISVEEKKRFPLKINKDITIPITYIWDRFDDLGDGVYKVVDYKSIRAYVTAADLKKKIQARLYALSVQLEYPDAKRIWVEFDLLRHEPIGVVFTKEENLATWHFLKREALRILNTKEEDAVETLNAECGYCVRKAECKTLTKHAAGGGILGLSVVELAKRKAEVAHALKAMKLLDSELDDLLAKEGESQGLYEFEAGEGVTVNVTAKKQRAANVDATRDIIGPELMAKYGNVTVSMIEKLLKSDELDDAQKSELKRTGMNVSFGRTMATVKVKSEIDDLEDI